MSISTSGPLFDSRNHNITPQIRESARIAGAYALFRLRVRSAVRTGQMRGGWQVRLVGNGLAIDNPVRHTIFNEMGTRYMAARPMARPTIPEAQKVFQLELARRVGRKLAADTIGTTHSGNIPQSSSPLDGTVFSALNRSAQRNGRRGFSGLKPGALPYSTVNRYQKRFGKAGPATRGQLKSRLADRVNAIAAAQRR